jgi:hypothetical protein
MTWAKRCFQFIATAPREVSAKDLEVRYNVPHPRRVLGELRQQNCIEPAFRVGRETFWRAIPGAPQPVDRRELSNKPSISLARRARQLKLKYRG